MRLSLCLLLAMALWLTGCETLPPGKDRNTGTGGTGIHAGRGLGDAVVLIIRHAEKSDAGPGLSAAGQERAQGYVRYFQQMAAGSTPLSLSYVVAAADSTNSHRPRLTAEPLSKALGVQLELRFTSQQSRELARELRRGAHGKFILICWRHGKIPDLTQALGAKPNKLLPHGIWPEDEYGMAIELRYDRKGHLNRGGATLVAEALKCPVPAGGASP